MSNSYVVCATLHGVTNVFNVEDLWMRAWRRQKGSFLMEALIDHPRTRRDRNHTETYYHHVIVRIPKADYDRDDRVEDGFNRAALIADLVQAHGDRIGDYVPAGETIRYRIEADPDLPKGQIRFLFGRAIYLPGDDEPPAYWLYRQGEAGRQELGLIYSGQRATLLNGDRYASTVAVPGWPFQVDQSVLVIAKPNQQPSVYPEPEDGRLTVRTEGQRIFLIADGNNAELCLRIEPQPFEQTDHRHEDLTWTPGGEPTSARHSLRVVGLALPRLSRHVAAGLQGWRLGFDPRGALSPCLHPDVVVRLRVDETDRIWGETTAAPELLAPPTVWQPSARFNLKLDSAPEPMNDHYCGWAYLPQSVRLPAPVNRWFCFGRGADAEINPGLLNDPDALIWGEARTVQPEQLLLSRRHLELRITGNGCTGRLLSDKWPAYLLNPCGEGHQCQRIDSRGQEFGLHRQELLVAGGYVMQLG